MDFLREPYDAKAVAGWLVCEMCGTQFPTADEQITKTCHICDDPRQFVPPSGQRFTTLDKVSRLHRNEFTTYDQDPRLTFIETAPKFAIGQRAILIRTPQGNVLWDCVALLDVETIAKITDLGGLKAMVISHPHYYTTHVQWARAFNCPVYLAADDKSWTVMDSSHQAFLTETTTDIEGTGAVAIKVGGPLSGVSRMGKWEVDALGAQREKPPGLNTFTFLWSIPNSIPLNPDELARMWKILRAYDFQATHGAFMGMDVEDIRIKKRVLDSMQIQTRFMGHDKHAVLSETV
ncbi:hypothetical protein HIM_02899 [Hirsutella minnesotensis 3608]|nr:hypothetical protein HIM_02899 [Hirsutella minnesotensis 3608]